MKIKNLVKIKIKEINFNTIHFTLKAQKWCILPYPGHPKGCPNYNKNPLCPPNAPFLKKIITKFDYFYLIYAKFDLLKYKKLMLNKHPSWSDRQATCILYWQSSVKKLLRGHIEMIYEKNSQNQFYLFSSGSGYKFHKFDQKKIYSMEAIGINVMKILKDNNIKFEIKPKNFVILVNLLCAKEKVLAGKK